MSRSSINRTLLYIILGALTLVNLAPFLFSVMGSFKDTRGVLSWPPRVFSPPFYPGNYAEVWNSTPLFQRWIGNSLILAVTGLVSKLLFAAMAGYAFARIKFPGRTLLFWLTMGALMVPLAVTLVPNYLILRRFHMINTYWAIIVPGFSEPFGVFLMTQFFKTLPREYEEAARVDGASRLTIFWQIMLPLAKPALLALAILKFRDLWNDFLYPLIFLNSIDMYTLPLGLNLLRSQYYTYWNLVLAGAMFSAVPVIIVFILLQRHLIRGIAMSGLKG